MKKQSALIFSAVTCLLGINPLAVAQTDTITITGTIFDFRSEHPDFERDNPTKDDRVTGCVESTLSPSGVPVPTKDAKKLERGECQIEHLEEWYTHNEKNWSTPFTVTLEKKDKDSDIYIYETPEGFFPIDGKLFGNEDNKFKDTRGKAHNFHFTFHLQFPFTYKEGDQFTFSGDDDVWVFVDDKLVLDLGGTHIKRTDIFSSEDLKEKGLIAGKRYNLDFFFAERHTNQSNFKIETSIIPCPCETGTGSCP